MNKTKSILTIMIIMGISTIIWFFAEPSVEISFPSRISYVVGGLSLTGLSLVFLLSSRVKWIENYFNGLDKVYVIHKYLSIFSVVAAIVHGVLTKVAPLVPLKEESVVAFTGNISRLLFVVLVVIALLAKKMKYENWRIFHRLLILPYIIGLNHTYINGKYDLLQMNILSFWVASTSIIGLAAAVYMLFIYQRISFKYKGSITSIKKLNNSVVELEITLDKSLNYKKGQYIFLKVFQEGLENAPHPFTISGGDGNKIYIGIKVLGDFTRKLFDNILLKTKVSIEGPYGHMIFEKGKQKQLWIAGGIGITPFLSYLRGGYNDTEINLYYSYHNKEEEVYKELLDEHQKKNPKFNVHYINTSITSRLKPESLTISDEISVFMCGPVKMVKGYANYFKKTNKNTEVIYEAFNFK